MDPDPSCVFLAGAVSFGAAFAFGSASGFPTVWPALCLPPPDLYWLLFLLSSASLTLLYLLWVFLSC